MANHKYMDIDVIPFLEAKMDTITQHYRSDFEIDKNILMRCASSIRPENKTLLWMAREMGTHCVKEHDAFVRDSAAFNTWRFYAEQTRDDIVACAVELTGIKDGVLKGNVYELDYRAHAAEVMEKAVPAQFVEKTFEDGHQDYVDFSRSSVPYYIPLVEKHGAIVDSIAFAEDTDKHAFLLAEQRRKRQALKPAREAASRSSLDSMIKNAGSRAGQAGSEQQTPDLSR